MEDDLWRTFPLESPNTRTPGVPRRFGVGVLMILVTFFAVVFAVLASLGASPRGFALVGIFFAGVAAGQVLLFGGKAPLRASILVGMVLFPLGGVALSLLDGRIDRIDAVGFFFGLVPSLLCSVFAGALAGHLAGAMLGAVVRTIPRRLALRRGALPAIALRPFSESDIDRLLGWIDSFDLLHRWARTNFREPLDRKQIERHLGEIGTAGSTSRAFAAVDAESGEPVGYAELRDIDPARGSATVAMALIGPDEPDRDRLSLALVRAVARLAFAEMGLRRVQTVVSAYDEEPRGCFAASGFATEGILRESFPNGYAREDERVMSLLRSQWLRDKRNRQAVGPHKPQPTETPEADGQ